ncbi:fish-egg lectin-like [Solea solea]|uniref:fish-egg lectin-like n=1 Tax=Solea solea TaxID=90069 RepID=UPI00272A8FB3|nr:fish-egg lectin-like [Solea solea]
MKAIAGCLLLVLCFAVECSWATWECKEAPRLYSIRQIDAGMGQVVAATRYGRPYQLSGRYWYSLGLSSLKHVSVGPAGTWGCDSSNKVYKLVGGNWKVVNGQTLQQVDAGGDGQVVGVAPTTNYSYCQRAKNASSYYGEGTLAWTGLTKPLVYVSCGKMFGCWGLDTNNKTFVAKKVNSTTCVTEGWTLVNGPKMQMIEVSTDGEVFGLTSDGKVFQRLGITDSLREGSSWKKIPMCMPISHLTYDLNHLWVVTTSGWLLQCTQEAAAPPAPPAPPV